jgi:hypothetical protein
MMYMPLTLFICGRSRAADPTSSSAQRGSVYCPKLDQLACGLSLNPCENTHTSIASHSSLPMESLRVRQPQVQRRRMLRASPTVIRATWRCPACFGGPSVSNDRLYLCETRTVRSTSLFISWKIKIGRDWYRSQIGRDLWAKVKMCTPVHGLSGFSAIKRTESPCTGVHIFTFAL